MSNRINRALLVALTAVSMGVGCIAPAEAFVGRLGSHSIASLKRFQQAAGRSVRSNRNSRRSGARSAARQGGVRHHLTHGKIGHHLAHGKSGRYLAHGKVGRHSVNGKLAHHLAHRASSPSYLWAAPSMSESLLSDETLSVIGQEFRNGTADKYAPATLLQAGVIASCPLRGGVFKRRTNVKHIILHSTETARVANAQRVITSWNNRGLRHAGAQFVVDRDGTIFCTANPDFGTTHVDNRRTIRGVNNDNSIGIEIVRAGTQEYSPTQLQSVVCLVRYLQDRYTVSDNMVLGHGQIQPSDRSDPVNFNWQAFGSDKRMLTRTAFADRR